MGDIGGSRRTALRLILIFVAMMGFMLTLASSALGWIQNERVSPNVYRFHNKSNGSHFYTFSNGEYWNTWLNLSGAYGLDGVCWTAANDFPSTQQNLYRFYNRTNGTHFYTADESEKANIIARLSGTYTYEGPAYKVSRAVFSRCQAVYRLRRTSNGFYLWTADVSESNALRDTGQWVLEGVAYYVAQTSAIYAWPDPVLWINDIAKAGSWTYVAAASPYYNCLGYAIGYDEWLWPGNGSSEAALKDYLAGFRWHETTAAYASIIAYGYPGQIRHFGRITSTTSTMAKNGKTELFSYSSWSPYNSGYGPIIRYYRYY